MFKFLKEKLKSAVKRVTRSVEEEPEEIIEIPKAEDFKQEEPELIEEIKEEAEEILDAEEIKEEPELIEEIKEEAEEILEAEEIKEEVPEVIIKEEPIIEEPKKEIKPKKEYKMKPILEEKKGFFQKIKSAVGTKKISETKFDELFWELEVAMLENNVAFEVIGKIKQDLKEDLVEKPLKRGDIEGIILKSLKRSVETLFDDTEEIDLIKKIKEKSEKPYSIVFLGANGSGKTTTIAKIAYFLEKKGFKCGLAAGDTWRSAAIQQLEMHAKKLNIPIVKHDYGADPAAVAFDAIKMGKAKHLDVILIDTAGRQHSNVNLIDEMKKIIRVANPDLKLYIGEMIAGNDCIEQIQSFDKAVKIDGAILTKVDVDEKGGTAISVTHVTKKPIYFLGVGQKYNDLEVFNKEKIIKNLGL
ncbi:MAG: signal recognition particle-docking protein FtsY [Nanoarchaeota archaeon]|nr:signal recognition particle-docking protein FtsY [Nanoarchaeota archaeon]